jgi:predicted Zn-dependent peptidase
MAVFYAPRSWANPGVHLLGHVKEITLDNGMKFLLLRREGAPVFSAHIQVKVGGVDEAAGQSGIAHLLEHMAFKGTSTIGTKDYEKEKVVLARIEEVHAKLQSSRGEDRAELERQFNDLLAEAGEFVVKEEFSRIYNRNGATDLNATTSADLTSYFVTLPNTKLRLWAYLESSRLRDPVFREFYSERDVVVEERRTRVDDSPFGKLYEAFIKLAFEKSPYRHPTIGYQADVERLSATDLKKFYEKYYVPQNMVGAVVGNIDLEETEQILREYFGGIPVRPPPPALQVREPEPVHPRQTAVRFDAAAALVFGYLKPKMPHADDYVFDVLDQVLCEGPTSRLYQRLVVREKLVQDVSCSPSTPGSRLDNLFIVYAFVNQGHNPSEVLQSFDEELKNIALHGVGPEEMEKAKKNLISQWYYELQSNDDIAQVLSYFEAVAGTWKYILGHPEKIQSVSGADVQRVIQTYLKPDRRRMAILIPVKK